MAGYMGLMRG